MPMSTMLKKLTTPPQQARSTEKTEEKPICRTCHEAKSAEESRWDDGFRPFVSVLNPHTTSDADHRTLCKALPCMCKRVGWSALRTNESRSRRSTR